MSEGYYDEEKVRQQRRVTETPDMKAQRAAVFDMLGLRAGERLLDVGSGNGIFAAEAVQILGNTGAVCGVDSADGMIAMAKEICPDGDFRKSGAEALPFENGSFDAVTASQLMCFMPEPAKVVAEMYRVLASGGRAVVLDTDWDSLVWNSRRPDLRDRIVENLMTPYASLNVPRKLTRWMQDAGFRIVERKAHPIVNWTRDPDSYSQQMNGFVQSMMRDSADFSQRDWQDWEDDQAALADVGEFMFSLNRYIFHGVKP